MRRTKKGFTLVELLVVVAIIVVLIALLMPAMDKAVRAAEIAKCGSNEHQIATAVVLYLSDQKRTMPFILSWVGLLGKQGDNAFTNAQNLTVKLRPLNAYLGYKNNGSEVPVAKCPGDRGDVGPNVSHCYTNYGSSYYGIWSNAYRISRAFGNPFPPSNGGPVPQITDNAYYTNATGTGQPADTKVRASRFDERPSTKIIVADYVIYGDRPISNPKVQWHDEQERKFNTLFMDMHVELYLYDKAQMENPAYLNMPGDPTFLWW